MAFSSFVITANQDHLLCHAANIANSAWKQEKYGAANFGGNLQTGIASVRCGISVSL
jgi:hypothetical protein